VLDYAARERLVCLASSRDAARRCEWVSSRPGRRWRGPPEGGRYESAPAGERRDERQHTSRGEAGETLARDVRSTPTHRTGNRAPRFLAATSDPV